MLSDRLVWTRSKIAFFHLCFLMTNSSPWPRSARKATIYSIVTIYVIVAIYAIYLIAAIVDHLIVHPGRQERDTPKGVGSPACTGGAY